MVTIRFESRVEFRIENKYLIPFESDEGEDEFEVENVNITGDGLVADIRTTYDVPGVTDIEGIDDIEELDLVDGFGVSFVTLWVKPEAMKEFNISIY